MSAVRAYQVAPGVYALASEDEAGQYRAPMTEEARELTGASAVFGSARDIAASPNVTKYASAAAAKAALQEWLDEGGA